MRKEKKAAIDAQPQLKPGTTIYSIGTGKIDIFKKASRDAAKYVSTLDGFIGATPYAKVTLWYFDSLNHAKAARNLMEGKGIECGDNICELMVAADGVPEMIGVCE